MQKTLSSIHLPYFPLIFRKRWIKPTSKYKKQQQGKEDANHTLKFTSSQEFLVTVRHARAALGKPSLSINSALRVCICTLVIISLFVQLCSRSCRRERQPLSSVVHPHPSALFSVFQLNQCNLMQFNKTEKQLRALEFAAKGGK